MSRTVMITGSEGFIGSNMVKYWSEMYPRDTIVRLDALTYAARQPLIPEENINTLFYKVDLATEPVELDMIMKAAKPDIIINYAAESHVCKSIENPAETVFTNIIGTFSLLESIRNISPTTKLIHISTDEVFGELTHDQPRFTEKSQILARSPYSSSKASSDLLCLAWHETYGLDIIVTNSSNVFGPNQHEEKLVAKTISKILSGEDMTIYGSGTQIRDWVYVQDHCRAIDLLTIKGTSGERYLIGGDSEKDVKEIVKIIEHCFYLLYPSFNGNLEVIHTNDRPTDDFRYAIDCSKLKALGWNPTPEQFLTNMMTTVQWYVGAQKKEVTEMFI